MEFVEPEDGVYDVVHVFVDKVHVDELNDPPAFPSPQDTVPVGVVGEFDVSVTVTVNVTAVPGTKGPEFGVTITDVVCTAATASDNVEELVLCVVSPP
jgi:hypothetical protein